MKESHLPISTVGILNDSKSLPKLHASNITLLSLKWPSYQYLHHRNQHWKSWYFPSHLTMGGSALLLSSLLLLLPAWLCIPTTSIFQRRGKLCTLMLSDLFIGFQLGSSKSGLRHRASKSVFCSVSWGMRGPSNSEKNLQSQEECPRSAIALKGVLL